MAPSCVIMDGRISCDAGDATNPEKHIYDEFFLVIERRGSTDGWRGLGMIRSTGSWRISSASSFGATDRIAARPRPIPF